MRLWGGADVIVFTAMQALADSKHMLFMETSAKADTNVKQLFDAIGREMKTSVKPTQSQGIMLELKSQDQHKKRAPCC